MSLNISLISSIKSVFKVIPVMSERGRHENKKIPKGIYTFGDFLVVLAGRERATSAFHFVQLRGLEARGHKLSHPKRQSTPFRVAHLMLVAYGKAPPLF